MDIGDDASLQLVAKFCYLHVMFLLHIVFTFCIILEVDAWYTELYCKFVCCRLICEGLAYLHFSYIAPRLLNAAASSARADSLSPLDVASELQNNVELHRFVSDEKKKDEWQKKNTSDFQRSVGILFLHRGDYMYELAQSVKLPHVDAAEKDAVRQLGKWTVNTALTIYASTSRRNDFFLLHGVTGAWSLMQVCLLLVIM